MFYVVSDIILLTGDPGYGQAPEGTLTAKRAASAADWVTHEINKLLDVIREIGTVGADGGVRVCFGELFYAYQVGHLLLLLRVGVIWLLTVYNRTFRTLWLE